MTNTFDFLIEDPRGDFPLSIAITARSETQARELLIQECSEEYPDLDPATATLADRS